MSTNPSKLRGTPTRLLLAVGGEGIAGEGGVPPLRKMNVSDSPLKSDSLLSTVHRYELRFLAIFAESPCQLSFCGTL